MSSCLQGCTTGGYSKFWSLLHLNLPTCGRQLGPLLRSKLGGSHLWVVHIRYWLHSTSRDRELQAGSGILTPFIPCFVSWFVNSYPASYHQHLDPFIQFRFSNPVEIKISQAAGRQAEDMCECATERPLGMQLLLGNCVCWNHQPWILVAWPHLWLCQN